MGLIKDAHTGGFAPLMAYNQIVGQPTVLDESRMTKKTLNMGVSLGGSGSGG